MQPGIANVANRASRVIANQLVALFFFGGTLSRPAFLRNLLVILPVALLSYFVGFALWFQLVLILTIVFSFAASVLRRLADTGLSRWIALVIVVPILGWLAVAILVSLPAKATFSQTPPVARNPRSTNPHGLVAVLAFVTISLVLCSPLALGTTAGGLDSAGSMGGQTTGLISPPPSTSPLPADTASATNSPGSSATAAPTPTPTSTPAPTKAPGAVTFASLITALPVAEETRNGYDRGLFRLWTDADGDGCDTRREVLMKESLTAVSVASGCWLSGGSWFSAYDSVKTTDPSTFDIDHFVPLKEAWDSGASGWDSATREAFANDLGYEGSLIAVSASSNRTKSDRDPSDWLPDAASYRCQYVFTWLQVKLRWGLAIDGREKAALADASAGCDIGALSFDKQAKIAETHAGSGAAAPDPAPGGSGGSTGGRDPRFDTCGDAIAAGYGEYRDGVDPEYDWYQDRDRDGVACER
jgi:hypothetical protein